MTSSDEIQGSVEERVKLAIEEVRPALQADGGDIVLDGVEGDVVHVRLVGACAGCPMARSTLTEFVAEHIQLLVPEIKEVKAG